jgi:hypothetical protein
MGTCGCGCGQQTSGGSHYLPGHDVKLRESAKAAWRESRDRSALALLRERRWLDNVKDVRSFGVEIECLIPVPGYIWDGSLSTSSYRQAQVRGAEILKEALAAQGLDACWCGYTHLTTGYWKIVTDASVYSERPGSNLVGLELVSPILRSLEGRAALRRACAALEAAGARFNRHTGLHVHHGAKGLTLDCIRHLALSYQTYQAKIDQMVSPSRVYNTYCMPIRESYLRILDSAASLQSAASLLDRYSALNLAAYVRHGTIEFRQHQGTCDARKILAWVDFGQSLIRAAKRGDSLVENLEDYTEMSSSRIEWWEGRRQALRWVA